MAEGFNAEGWYVGRKDAASEWKGGPYTWAQLVAYAAEGRLAPGDLVWHESLPDWVLAESVPGLMPAPQQSVPATGAPAPAPEPVPAPAPEPGTPRPRGRGVAVGLSIAAAVLLVLAVGGGAFWAWSTGKLGGGQSGGHPDLGIAQVVVPDSSKLVTTQAYGEVPADQIGVVLKDGSKRKAAEKLAGSLGGKVVGEIEYVNTYQIQFPGSSEADLKRAISSARADSAVQLAFPNQQVKEYAEIKGVRVDPYDDPLYGGGIGDGYKALGVSKAWAYIRGSGIQLHDSHVGIVDAGLYAPGQGRESEFGGDVQIDFPDPAAGRAAAPSVNDDGSVNEAGTHGTGVATIIGADPGNGGPSGVAGPLGKKLRISMINHDAGQYGTTTSTPDPNDPTKLVWSNGKTYSLGGLVALKKQVETGARVINCSWGADVCDPQLATAYKNFFVKMAAEHPNVTFVCAAGNTGGPLDNRTSFPSGHNLPNMITVGAVDNDGKLAEYSTTSGDHYVVDIAAPGTDAVVGMGAQGGAVRQNGTSFSTPEVTASVAILLAINPELSAAQVKKILLDTARKGTTVGEPGSAGYMSNVAPPETGGRVLALDEAVLSVINAERAKRKLDPLTPEMLEKMGVIDAVAVTDKPGEYKVKGIVEATGEQGTEVTIDVTGENHAIGGKTLQKLGGAGEVTWDVSLPKDSGTILVKRLDNGAASLITIESYDINGKWAGTFTVTDVKITDEEAAKGEGCGAVFFEALKGKALPMTMDVTADESGNGSADTLIDVSSLNKPGEGGVSSEPQRFGLNYAGSTVTFDMSGSKGVSSMVGQVSRDDNNLVMKGVLTGGGKGWSIRAVFTLTKPVQ
jgi:hypothetical protein